MSCGFTRGGGLKALPRAIGLPLFQSSGRRWEGVERFRLKVESHPLSTLAVNVAVMMLISVRLGPY